MAGLGTKLWTSGEVVTAANVNAYLQDQTIGTYASTTARDAAFGGTGEPTLSEGMFAYTTDTNTLWLYSGATNGWVNLLGSDIGQQALSNRNVIINGAMQVAQRGSSLAGFTGGDFIYRTADRFNTAISSLGTWTESIENDAPTGSGLRKSIKFLCTTADASPAAADYFIFNQSLEGQNIQQFLKGTSSAKPFALSFWVKSNVTGTYTVNLRDIDNTRSCAASYSVSASATWEKKTIIFPADTTGAFDNDNAASLRLTFNLALGSSYTSGTLGTTWASNVDANLGVGQTNLASAINNYWQVTGVQLEAGSVATPFEFEDYGTTLAKCQRYFQKIGPISYVANGMAYSTTQGICTIFLAVPMRIAPGSITVSATASHYEMVRSNTAQTACSAVPVINNANPNVVAIIGTIGAADLVAGNATFLVGSNSTSGWIGVNAEL